VLLPDRAASLTALSETARLLDLIPVGTPVEEAVELVRERMPWLAAQLADDAQAGRFARWGLSTMIDENIAVPVLPDAAFGALHRLAGIASSPPIGNAGILHVYGYLLSSVVTPYGLKRERWTEGGVARAFGLPHEYFAPWFDDATTPLERVLSAALPILERPESADASLRLWTDEHQAPDEGTALVRTVVVQNRESGAGALLYGIRPDAGELQLVTVFPVDTLDSAWLDEVVAQPPRLRFNAVIEGRQPGCALGAREVLARN
jgi:hypothetical protein